MAVFNLFLDVWGPIRALSSCREVIFKTAGSLPVVLPLAVH